MKSHEEIKQYQRFVAPHQSYRLENEAEWLFCKKKGGLPLLYQVQCKILRLPSLFFSFLEFYGCAAFTGACTCRSLQ